MTPLNINQMTRWVNTKDLPLVSANFAVIGCTNLPLPAEEEHAGKIISLVRSPYLCG